MPKKPLKVTAKNSKTGKTNTLKTISLNSRSSSLDDSLRNSKDISTVDLTALIKKPPAGRTGILPSFDTAWTAGQKVELSKRKKK